MPQPGLSFQVIRPAPTLAVRADRGALPGLFARGPSQPVLVVGPEQLEARYGSSTPGMLGARAAMSFFDNGGTELLVARVLPPEATAASGPLPLAGTLAPDGDPGSAVELELAEVGAFGNDVRLRPQLRLRRRLLGTVGTAVLDGDRLTPSGGPRPDEVDLPARLSAAGGLVRWSRLGAIAGTAYTLSPTRESLNGLEVVIEVFESAFAVVVEEPNRADVVVEGIDLADYPATRARLQGTPLRLPGSGSGPFDVPLPDVSTSLSGGSDGLESGSSASLATAFRAAFDALDASEVPDIVFCPDLWSRTYRTKGIQVLALDAVDASSLTTGLVDRAASRADRIVVVDPPLVGVDAIEQPSASELVAWRADLATQLGAARDFAATYVPWVRAVSDIVFRGDDTMLEPPSAYVAGQLARTARERGAWTSTGAVALVGPVGLGRTYSPTDLDALSDVGINPLRTSSAGTTIEGVRSLSYPDRRPWGFLSTRRLFNYLRRALLPLGLSYTFAPNAPATWIQLRRDVEAMLRDLFTRGAFAGSRPQDGFFVKVDADLNPEAARDAGVLTARVGVAPAAPLEFLVVSLRLQADEVSVVEASS